MSQLAIALLRVRSLPYSAAVYQVHDGELTIVVDQAMPSADSRNAVILALVDYKHRLESDRRDDDTKRRK